MRETKFCRNSFHSHVQWLPYISEGKSITIIATAAVLFLLLPGCQASSPSEPPEQRPQIALNTDPTQSSYPNRTDGLPEYIWYGENLANSTGIELHGNQMLYATIAKWYDNHRAAISIMYDHGWGWPQTDDERLFLDIVARHGLPIDFDAVTANFTPEHKAFLQNTLVPLGISFFGHGHWHVDHDLLSYTDALESFRKCYAAMENLGLKPVAYAYPGGAGNKPGTRKALQDAGFLSGRLFHAAFHANPYIIPHNETEPPDWFALPTLIIQNYEYQYNEETIHNTQELIPFLDGALKRRAWITSTYHEISDGPGGTYTPAKFEQDLTAIAERDFWVASMNDVTLYARERANATINMHAVYMKDSSLKYVELQLQDGLPNERYDQELTILLSIPGEWIGRELAIQQGNNNHIVRPVKSECMLSLLPNEQPYRIRLR